MTNLPAILLADTTANRDKWLEVRADYVGSSEIVTICGLNKYESAFELWCRRTGKTEQKSSTPAMQYGRDVQSAIVNLARLKLTDFTITENDNTFVNDKYPLAMATPDAFTFPKSVEAIVNENPLQEKPLSILEIKHTSADFDAWADDGAPDAAQCQVHWQMGVMSVPFAHIAAVVGGRASDLKTPSFHFNQSIFDQMYEKAEGFMKAVSQDMPLEPGPGDAKRIAEVFPKIAGKSVPLGASAQTLADYIAEVKADKRSVDKRARELKELVQTAENKLKIEMGDASVAELPDGRLITVSEVNRGGYSVGPSSYQTLKIKG